MLEKRFCKHCKVEHPNTPEHWRLSSRAYRCRIVERIAAKQYACRNRELVVARHREWRQNNREKYNAARTLYRQNNPEKKQAQDYRYREKHREAIAAKRKASRPKTREYVRNYYRTNVQFKLGILLRNRLKQYLKATKSSAVRELGCTLSDLKIHLESQFQPGMSWDNWSATGWHIDHIKPLSSFDLTDPEQFKNAVHYTNLQPLWAIDNLKKNDRITHTSPDQTTSG